MALSPYTKYFFFLYVIGSVFLCGSGTSGLYLNHTIVTLTNNINIVDGFSFSFRTCSHGVMLKEENDSIILSLLAGNSTNHAALMLTWKYNNGLASKSVTLFPLFSLNSNILLKVEVKQNGTGSSFSISSNKIGVYPLYIKDIYLLNSNNTGDLLLGSKDFTGCLYSGRNINLNTISTNYCSLEFDAPCDGKICPKGFTGRYCHEDINECLSSSEHCHSFSQCIDLVNSFKCICGPRWTGKLCNIPLGGLCKEDTCKNKGICRETQDRNNYTCTCTQDFTGHHCESLFYPCLNTPCKNGATCFNSSNYDFNCTCKSGFYGIYCENQQNLCAGKCGQGECINLINNYTCNCNGSGFGGDQCQNNINECINSPCKHNATCQDRFGSYNCLCKAGYTDTNCETNIDDCAVGPCQNNGTCSDLINGFDCACSPGFEGKRCEVDINECDKLNPCKKFTKCIDKLNDYECICKPGYEGKNCDINIDECQSKPCKNNGTCEDEVGAYKCIHCALGFTGVNCSENINDCNSTLCVNNGTCIDMVNKYTCSCAVGFSGKNCEINTNDCQNDTCKHYGICIDGVNDYTCTCMRSYTGKNCETFQDPCTPINPCENGICLNDSRKGYKCNCKDGFGGDLCQHKLGICYPKSPCVNGTCTEANGLYNCTCDAGYTGMNCSENINECNLGSVSCKNGGICIDTPGSYYCNCTGTGFEGPLCENDVDECNPNPCKNGRPCENLKNKFLCDCGNDYGGTYCDADLLFCPHYKQKNGEPYCKNGSCIELPGTAIDCVCKDGYEGARCDKEIDECKFNYCQHNSTCTDLLNDYRCTCAPGYTGRNCSQNIDECNPDPCMHSGTCKDLVNGFKCNCKIGYNGSRCENDIDWCLSSPCKHGGRCMDSIETYQCACLPGFTRKDCSIDINECKPNPCQFESSCIERSNLTALRENNFPVNESSFVDRDGYICKCLLGLNGTNCEINFPDCNNETKCEHNSTCVDLVNDYKCSCLPGYKGKYCEIDINECIPSPCFNNAACINLINDYKCNCPDLFTGKNCNTSKEYCMSHKPCKNNAECYSNGSSYTCVCQRGYTGVNCDQLTTVNFNRKGYWKHAYTSGNVSARFKTTLQNGILFHVQADKNASLHLTNNKLILTMNGKDTVLSLDIVFNNELWHRVKIILETTKFDIVVDDILINETYILKNARNIYIGGTEVSGIQPSNKGSGMGFIGCIQDVIIDNKVMVSKRDGVLVRSTAGNCNRTKLCLSNSCNNSGQCIDKWITKKCSCYRQYFGDECQHEIVPFNFQLPTTNSTRRRRSTRSMFITSVIDFTLNDTTPFSFMFRTRQINSVVALLLSATGVSSSYVSVHINDGKLNVTSNIQSSVKSTVLPVKQNDGKWHEVIIKSTAISDNNKSFAHNIADIHINNVFLGGVDNYNLYPNIIQNTPFDGCMQAVKVGDSVLTNQVIPGNRTSVSLNDVGSGCPSVGCKPSPCLFNGTCSDLWNDYQCDCVTGFKGQNCSIYGCRNKHSCSSTSACVDIPNQPGQTKCSIPLTYNGVNSKSEINITSYNSSDISFDLRTRQLNAFILGSFESSTNYLAVSVKNGMLSIDAGKIYEFQGLRVNDGVYHNIRIERIGSRMKIVQDSTELSSGNLLPSSWPGLLTIGKSKFKNNSFMGCIRGVFINNQSIDLDNAVNKNTKENCSSTLHSCSPSPCTRGKCEDDFNDFRCTCPKHYTKITCNETLNVTCAFETNSTKLCNNSATCINLNAASAKCKRFSQNGLDYFECQCKPGYEGYFCNNETNECAMKPCKNGATCKDLKLDYKCSCKPGWTNKNCTENINDCFSGACVNNGSCNDLVNGYNCTCTDMFKGANCSIDVNECEVPNQCLNKGNCMNVYGSYNCSCTPGYFGQRCEYNNTMLCEQKFPCGNYGDCHDNITGYYCNCHVGIFGENCQQDFNECINLVPCKNGGVCSDSHTNPKVPIKAGYNCTCTINFKGKNCTEEIDPCDSSPCKNNGLCHKLKNQAFKCNCTSSFTGKTCAVTGNVLGDVNIALIVSLVVVGVILITVAIVVFRYCHNKSGTEGTYSPNKEEQQSGPVEMNTLKKPNTERLI